MKTVEAHKHFVVMLSWGRQRVSIGTGKANGANRGDSKLGEEKLVNVIASAGVDQIIKIWLP